MSARNTLDTSGLWLHTPAMFNTNHPATKRKNERCIEAVKLKADGLTFRQIGERFNTTQDPARSMVARGVRLLATTEDIVKGDGWMGTPAVLRARGAI